MIEGNWKREDKRKRQSLWERMDTGKKEGGGKSRLNVEDAVSLSKSKHTTVWISVHEEALFYSHGWSDTISPREKDKD